MATAITDTFLPAHLANRQPLSHIPERGFFCFHPVDKLKLIDVIDAGASSEVHGVGAYAPWSRTCVASSPQLNFSPAFPGKNQRHLWFFENACDDLRAVLHVES